MTDSALTTTQHTGSIYTSHEAFDMANRAAKALCLTPGIPRAFQGQQGLTNCLMALEIGQRMNMSVIQVMNNLDFIHGKIRWGAKFVQGMVIACGRFTDIHYEIEGKGSDMSCVCVATDVTSGRELRGPKIDMKLAKSEGWIDKTGSKWKTMPEHMLMKRSAQWFGEHYIPDLLEGISFVDRPAMSIEPITISEESTPEPVTDEIF
jgi:hypothetical protein